MVSNLDMSRPFAALLAVVAVSLSAEAPRGVPMVDVEACQIEFAFPPGAMKHATWGGQIAIYDVSVGSNGAVTAVKRRMMEGREHLAKLVKLAPFESCIHGWRFQERGEYTVSLIGGNMTGPHWIIDVRADSRWFRLRIPVRWPTG
jgi:hypothetical protein